VQTLKPIDLHSVVLVHFNQSTHILLSWYTFPLLLERYNTHRGDFFENVFFVDSRHPTPFGHEMVASMMLKRLSTQLDPCARSGGTANGAGGSWFFGQPDIEYVLPKATKHITEKMKQGKVLLDGMVGTPTTYPAHLH